MAEHLEPTPLARAEWLEFFALFFNKEREAAEAFEAIESAYVNARSELVDEAERPKVLVGAPQRDGWSIYGGRNVGATMIGDAGGDYLWAENRSSESGTAIPFEAALARAQEADVWIIGPDAAWGTGLEQQTIADRRFGFVPAVDSRRVFIAHANYPDGPNPWWDYALVEPHLELRDLKAILHPETHGDHLLRFYRRLEQGRDDS
jgi:iron complex transport system substrate-binding protein